MPSVFVKRPGEIRAYGFDFRNLPEVAQGDSLASGATVVVAPSGLTLGSPTITGTQVRTVLSGGVDGTTYLLTASVVTAAGRTLECVGTLVVSAS